MAEEGKEPTEPEAPADETKGDDAPASSAPAPTESDPFGLGPLSSGPKQDAEPDEANAVGAISSGPFQLSRASFAEILTDDLPPSTGIASAMGQGDKGLPLRTIVGITAGVLVVAIGLSLLLFR